MTDPPKFLILSAADCRDVLERNHVGRLAFINQGTVDIEPIGYVSRDKWVYLRSAWGAKLEALTHNPYVAFEVDETDGQFDWRSVVAHGTVYLLSSDGAHDMRKDYEAAVAALRSVTPDALTERDPTPARQIVYGLHIDALVGRMARRARPKHGDERPEVPLKPPPARRDPPAIT